MLSRTTKRPIKQASLHPKWETRLQIQCARKNAEIAVDLIRTISKQRLSKKIDRLSKNKTVQLRKLITDMHGVQFDLLGMAFLPYKAK